MLTHALAGGAAARRSRAQVELAGVRSRHPRLGLAVHGDAVDADERGHDAGDAVVAPHGDGAAGSLDSDVVRAGELPRGADVAAPGRGVFACRGRPRVEHREERRPQRRGRSRRGRRQGHD